MEQTQSADKWKPNIILITNLYCDKDLTILLVYYTYIILYNKCIEFNDILPTTDRTLSSD